MTHQQLLALAWCIISIRLNLYQWSKKVVNINQFRKLLLQNRDKLNTILQTTAEAASTVELDQSRVGRLSRMDALQAQSMSQESQRRNVQQLLDIDKALKRIDNDEFGDCFECGEAIDPQRLELNPTTTLCIGCATKKERG